MLGTYSVKDLDKYTCVYTWLGPSASVIILSYSIRNAYHSASFRRDVRHSAFTVRCFADPLPSFCTSMSSIKRIWLVENSSHIYSDLQFFRSLWQSLCTPLSSKSNSMLCIKAKYNKLPFLYCSLSYPIHPISHQINSMKSNGLFLSIQSADFQTDSSKSCNQSLAL
jgi:hypothetical protein